MPSSDWLNAVLFSVETCPETGEPIRQSEGGAAAPYVEPSWFPEQPHSASPDVSCHTVLSVY